MVHNYGGGGGTAFWGMGGCPAPLPIAAEGTWLRTDASSPPFCTSTLGGREEEGGGAYLAPNLWYLSLGSSSSPSSDPDSSSLPDPVSYSDPDPDSSLPDPDSEFDSAAAAGAAAAASEATTFSVVVGGVVVVIGSGRRDTARRWVRNTSSRQGAPGLTNVEQSVRLWRAAMGLACNMSAGATIPP